MSNPKDIKDYLPYYIGQEVVYLSNGEGILSEISIDSTYGMLCSVKLKGGKNQHLQTTVDKIKLRLRPLSDMTEEESDIVLSYDDDNNEFPDSITNAAAAFHYLLKQGFDLFGLIPDGLAIDKTKINNDAK